MNMYDAERLEAANLQLKKEISWLHEEVERLKQRETDLLEANNRYLEEAREARRLNKFFSMFNPEFMKAISSKIEQIESERDNALKRARESEVLLKMMVGKIKNIRHYKGGEYFKFMRPVKVQISIGDERLYHLDPLLPPRRVIRDGDELILYVMKDGSMSFARFPDEMNDPNRFVEITNEDNQS